MIFRKPNAYLVLILGFLLSGCATNPVSGKQDFVLMSEAQEIALGKQSHQQILKEYEVYQDAKVQAVMNRVGQAIAAKSHRNQLDFTFTVLDSPEINAFALPGGYVYITRGIMAYLNSEEELAGVIGHEIGHVTARHGVKQQSAQSAAGLMGVLVAVATGNKGIAQNTSLISNALVSGYGRNHELEADRLGAEYLARTGMNPESMLKVIGVLKNQELFAKEKAKASGEPAKAGYHGVFSSHPDNDKRLQEVIRAAKKFQTARQAPIDSSAFLQYTDGLVFGDSEAQGIIRKHEFFHKSLNLHITFPENWQLINKPDRLLAVAPNKAQIIQFMLGDPKAQNARGFLRKTFPSLSLGESRGKNIYTGSTELDSPWGKRNGRVAAVRHQDKMFLMMAVGSKQTPNLDFFNSVSSLGKIRRNQRKYANGKKIKLIRVKRGDTFARLAKRSNLGQYEVSQLRLINGLYPSGEPTVGRFIKIVQ